MKVFFRKSFEKDLDKLRDKTLLAKIKAEIEVVENAETLQDMSNLKKLKSEDNHYRIRIGLTADEDIITFVTQSRSACQNRARTQSKLAEA